MKQLFCLLIFIAQQFITHGQDSLSVVSSQKDIKDVFSKGSKYKKRDRRFQLAWAPGAAYTLSTGFALAVGFNGSFHTGNPSNSKLSSATLNFAYTEHNQIILPFIANIWSQNEKWQYAIDWRFMKYPSETWGLAGEIDPNDGYTINFSYIKLHQLALRAIGKHLFIGSGIYYDNIWDITEVSAPPDGSTSYQQYGLSEQEIAVALPIRLLYDSRLNQINPTNGWFCSLTWRNNLKALGSNKQWQSIVLDMRKYFQVSKPGNVLAFWLYNWQSTNETPYILLPSTGWDDNFNFGRGYIQGRFRSINMHYVEMEFRFKITSNGLLGAVAFANLQAYKLNLTEGPYAFSPAVGTGLRIKLNKKSGTNLSIDYGIGQNGSHGFFVNLGEVF